jgi:hypothetical protein
MAVLVMGLTPMCPRMIVVPVVEIPAFDRIVNWAAPRRFTGVCTLATAGAQTKFSASTRAGFVASGPDGLNVEMGRALPRTERLARVPMTDKAVMVFTIADPLFCRSRAANIRPHSATYAEFGVRGPVVLRGVTL